MMVSRLHNSLLFRGDYYIIYQFGLTDPGTITFEERGILVKESVGVAQVPVLRKNGADGEVSVRWRTIGKPFYHLSLWILNSPQQKHINFLYNTDKNAVSGKAYIGGEGCLVFKHSEVS